MIHIKGLVHNYIRYGNTEEENTRFAAIDGVDLNVKEGQFIAILGHNGSGKSTLAKHLNVLLLPSEGKILIDGKDTSDEKNLWDIRRLVSMVFQNPDNQIVGATVEEDVAFGLENQQLAPDYMNHQIDKSLREVSLTEKKYVNPMDLSGGQKQKVAIAGAIATFPKCLVLDESTAMLDPKAREDVISIAKKLNKEYHMTLILITHHMEEVVDADYIVVMEHGKIVMNGTPMEVFAKPKELYACHMEVPVVTKMAQELKEAGLPLQTPVLHVNDLLKQLKQLEFDVKEGML